MSKKDSTKLTLLTLTFSGLLLSCSHHVPAPVFDLNLPTAVKLSLSKTSDSSTHISSAEKADSYIVNPGDTLFSIAWNNNVDHAELAQINKLRNNIIYPGQILLLKSNQHRIIFDRSSLLAALNQEVLTIPVTIYQTQSIASLPSKVAIKPFNSVQKIDNKTMSEIKSTQSKTESRTIAATPASRTTVNPTRSSVINQESDSDNEVINWIWPADGEILANFSSNLNANRGLDIAAKKGQPVRATAPGRVVYEGNGLRGYGNLVIIKHSNNYLSAYAHNEKIHVTENEFVNAGQRIADVGSSGTSSDKLHFEIRFNGKPVDPLNYLPEKKL